MFRNLITKIEQKFIAWYDAYRAKRAYKFETQEWNKLHAAAMQRWPKDGANKMDHIIASNLLTNQIAVLRSQRSVATSQPKGGFIQPFDEGMFKIAAKVVDTIIGLHAIVGVQPLSAPVGLVFLLAFKSSPNDPETPPDVTHLRLELVKRAVEAYTRRLSVRWNMEIAQDLHTIHGLDFETELTTIISKEIGFEIVNEVVSDLKRLAVADGNVSQLKLFSSYGPTEVSTDGLQLAIAINAAANNIGKKARRGAGNFAIMSPLSVSLLQCMPSSAFVGSDSVETVSENFPLKFVGTLNDKIKIYCDYNAGDDVLVGYVGSGGSDTGYVYSPYVPVMGSGVIVDPATFQPVMTLMTRYGKYVSRKDDTTVFHNSADYYQVIKLVTNEQLSEPQSDIVTASEDPNEDVEVKQES